MKWLVLSLKLLFRNKRRTLLTMGSVALALFVFTTLRTVLEAVQISVGSGAGETRLAVIERYGGPRTQLPASYQSRLSQFPGVIAAAPTEFAVLRVGAQDPVFYVAVVTDPEAYRAVFTSSVQSVTSDQYAMFIRTRNGALVGRELMQRYGWKIGDRIQMASVMDRVTFDFIICGELRNLDGQNAIVETQLRIQRQYYDELTNPSGKVNVYWLRLDSPASVPSVIRAVEEYYKDGPREVSVQTESSMLARLSSFTATIQLVLNIISAVVLFTILIVAANTIALSMRERRKEIAVMKALGFTARGILGLALLEAVATSLIGGIIGTLVAYGLFNAAGVSFSLGLTYKFNVTLQIVLTGAAVSTALGLLSGLFPAWNAARVSVIRTLRSV